MTTKPRSDDLTVRSCADAGSDEGDGSAPGRRQYRDADGSGRYVRPIRLQAELLASRTAETGGLCVLVWVPDLDLGAETTFTLELSV